MPCCLKKKREAKILELPFIWFLLKALRPEGGWAPQKGMETLKKQKQKLEQNGPPCGHRLWCGALWDRKPVRDFCPLSSVSICFRLPLPPNQPSCLLFIHWTNTDWSTGSCWSQKTDMVPPLTGLKAVAEEGSQESRRTDKKQPILIIELPFDPAIPLPHIDTEKLKAREQNSSRPCSWQHYPQSLTGGSSPSTHRRMSI